MEALYPLIALACPVGMGLMMWFMMRGSKQGGRTNSIDELRTEQHRLQAEIDRREPADADRLGAGAAR